MSGAWRSPHPAEITVLLPAYPWETLGGPCSLVVLADPGPMLGAETLYLAGKCRPPPSVGHPRSEAHGRSSASKAAVGVQPSPDSESPLRPPPRHLSSPPSV